VPAIQELQRETKGAEARRVPPKSPAEPCLPSHEMVAKRAFEIWQRHGCPHGTEYHDWLAAEAELRSRR
jgi:hypothetical protein